MRERFHVRQLANLRCPARMDFSNLVPLPPRFFTRAHPIHTLVRTKKVNFCPNSVNQDYFYKLSNLESQSNFTIGSLLEPRKKLLRCS